MLMIGRKIQFFARGLWPSSSKGSYRATPSVSVGPRFFCGLIKGPSFSRLSRLAGFNQDWEIKKKEVFSY